MSAVNAAVAAARAAGVRVKEPRVLRESSSVIVLLAPGGPVARVAGLTAAVRDNRAHRTREVDVARFLADVGCIELNSSTSSSPRPPVVAPHDPAGPFEHDGQLVTLWEYAQGGLEQDPSAIGSSLRWCHEQLRSYPKGLPHLTTLFDEAVDVLEHGQLDGGDKRLVKSGLAQATEAMKDHPVQPIHGDAGLGNVLVGPKWNDWEDACIGPVEWDLACLVTSARITGRRRDVADAALHAYGGELPDVFVQARGLQVVAWSGFAAASGVETRLEQRLAWLRSQ